MNVLQAGYHWIIWQVPPLIHQQMRGEQSTHMSVFIPPFLRKFICGIDYAIQLMCSTNQFVARS